MDKKSKIFLLFTIAVAFCSCYYRTDAPRGTWAKGADLSWLSEMEHDSVLFYDEQGRPCCSIQWNG